MQGSILLGAVLVLGSGAAPQRARACGGTPCAQRMDVMPAEGASEVPTNTELRVLYFGTLQGCDLPLLRMRLVDEVGGLIEIDAAAEEAGPVQAWMVARPAAPLLARTSYALEVQAGDADNSWTKVSQFTTGDGDDVEPPAFGGVDSIELDELVDATSNCGRTFGIPLQIAFESARDRSPDVRYDVYVDSELADRYVGSFDHELWVDCGTAALQLWTPLQPGAHVQLRAVDMAGNVSELSSEITVEADCMPIAAGSGGSCAAAHSRSSVTLGAWFGALALARRRREKPTRRI